MIMTTITGDYCYGKYSIMMNNAKPNSREHHPTPPHLRHSSPTLNLIDPENNSYGPLNSDDHSLPGEEIGQPTSSCSSSYYYYGNDDMDIEHDYTINYPANERKSIINSARNNYIENNNDNNDNTKAQRKTSMESLLFEIKEPIQNDQLWNKRCDEPINPQPCDLLTSDEYEKIYQQLLKHFSRKITFNINTVRPNDLSNNMAGTNLEPIPNNYSDDDPHTWPSNWQSQAPSMILAPENYLSKKPTLNEYQRRLIRRIALKYEPLFYYYRQKMISNEIGTESMSPRQTSSKISATQPLKTFSNYSSPDSSSCSLSSYSGHEDDNLDYLPTTFNNNLNAKNDIESTTTTTMSSTMNNKHINTNLTKTMAMLKDYTGNDCLNINHTPLTMTKSTLKPFSYQNLDNISKNNSKTEKHYQQQQHQQHNPDPYTFNVIANCSYNDEEIINQRQRYEISPTMIVTGGNPEEEDNEECFGDDGDDESENDANNRFIDDNGHIMITSSKPMHMNRNIGHRELSGSVTSSPMSLIRSTKIDSIRSNKKSNHEHYMPTSGVASNYSSNNNNNNNNNSSKLTPIHHLHKWSAKMKDYLKKNN